MAEIPTESDIFCWSWQNQILVTSKSISLSSAKSEKFLLNKITFANCEKKSDNCFIKTNSNIVCKNGEIPIDSNYFCWSKQNWIQIALNMISFLFMEGEFMIETDLYDPIIIRMKRIKSDFTYLFSSILICYSWCKNPDRFLF